MPFLLRYSSHAFPIPRHGIDVLLRSKRFTGIPLSNGIGWINEGNDPSECLFSITFLPNSRRVCSCGGETVKKIEGEVLFKRFSMKIRPVPASRKADNGEYIVISSSFFTKLRKRFSNLSKTRECFPKEKGWLSPSAFLGRTTFLSILSRCRSIGVLGDDTADR